MHPYVAALAVGLTAGLLAPARAADPLPVASFETDADLARVTANNVNLAATDQGVSQGRRALRVEFAKADWPNVSWRAGEKAWDWRAYGTLAVDVTNPGADEVTFAIRVDDDPSADGARHCVQGSARVGPGERATFGIHFGGAADPMAFGMRGLPMPVGLRPMGRGGKVDASHIVAFQVFLPRPEKAHTLLFDNLRLLPPPSLEGIVDAYGQYARADWPGKVKSDADFARQHAEEDADLHTRPSLPGLDQYGGWADGPKLRAAGFFRAEERDGKWWLVTPEGTLFLSLGMDCVRTDNSTMVEKREQMFTWLPKEGDPLARFYGRVNRVHSGPVPGGRTYDFTSANLVRKYGADYFPAWRDVTLARLRSWGFNTIANWSDTRVCDAKRMPFVATLNVAGNHARLAGGSDYWGTMHDPFDPQFAADAANSFRERAPALKDDPWCVGYFVDNELSWGGWGDDGGRYGLARGALVAPAGSPGKAAFVAQLKAKYGAAAALNAAWGTQIASWETLEQPFEPARPLNAAMKADMGAFTKALALKYFTVVRDALRQFDPNHLYLGCRFAWRTQEAVDAAAQVCDVVSFNIYRRSVEPAAWEFTKALGKPCIIGEFHFGALDRGMLHTGLVATASQEERARTYQEYIRSVVDHPAFVGCHWFQYKDQALTGRTLDGENYNIGFVSGTDTPYAEMVAAARAVHAEAYRRRAGR